ncbi:MAG: hypothetical protein MUF65_10375, partial [Rubritepida sp.]|nr:hypothetical protein [Rubritepida sp.]
MQRGVRAARGDEPRGEGEQPCIGGPPIHPGERVVLAVGVVVAVLGAAQLVAHREHRHAAREQQRGEQRARVGGAARADAGVLRRSLMAVVPGEVLVAAVAVVLAVRRVVLAGEAHEVGQGEAVMRGDEVHAVAGPAGQRVGRAGEARGERAGHARVATPEAPDVVAEAVVPGGPAGREGALVVARHVPWLDDDPPRGEHRVLPDGGEQGRVRVEGAVGVAPAEHGGEVEAEAVHARLQRPVAQRVHDEAQHRRPVAGEHVAAAAFVLAKPVPGGLAEAAQVQRGAQRIALAGVVEHHVEDDRDARRAQRLHRRADLGHPAGGQARIGRERADGVVAPVIGEAERRQVAFLHPGGAGQQLDRGDAEAREVRED